MNTKKNKQTGTLISVNRQEEYNLANLEEPWITMCEDHGIFCGHERKIDAVSWASQPSMWCEGCQELAGAK